ncbi:hypothetical protein HaLaN_30393, partial [Haematococcus lacustris]
MLKMNGWGKNAMTKNWAAPTALVLAFLALALSVASQSTGASSCALRIHPGSLAFPAASTHLHLIPICPDPDPFTGALAWLQDFGSMTQRQQNMALFGVGVAIQSRTGMVRSCHMTSVCMHCKHQSMHMAAIHSSGTQSGTVQQQTVCAHVVAGLQHIWRGPCMQAFVQHQQLLLRQGVRLEGPAN